ncbi:ATP-binding protein [Propionimicrobium sp. PCR01-08-3]|uniref:AAA family ATPase n=1 Tax=Propionimicrobium sp. PCR01-08-3 TaxID=3052086 RepID=UPI00255C7849|nr:ATP-binding protein [Propionimicrobium sp. PCR01-08-3]WIY83310.1 ATP-binding protein [Propionimicrobium sp. PCR01-08-3]
MALIAMAGLPGVGKTTVAKGLAEHFGGVLVNVDDVESSLVKAEFERSFATGLASYLVAEQVARANLGLGSTVIVDAANSASYARDMWTSLAREYNVPLLFVEVVCTDLAVHAERLATRPLPPGIQRIGFDEVVVKYAESESWGSEPRWLVNTASGVDHDQLFAEVSDALANL